MMNKIVAGRFGMVKLDAVVDKWSGLKEKVSAWWNAGGSVYSKIKKVIGVIVMTLYRLRRFFLAAPVVYYALKLAKYNREHLPELVGVNLQSNGIFADFISRDTAVMYPLGITAACLVLMFFCRKPLWPWAVSLFTLALPILLLVSNMYPM